MKKALHTVFFCLNALLVFGQIQPIGNWRAHVSMQNIFSVDSINGKIIAASSNGYFTYDPLKNEIITQSKSTGLSDISVKVFSKQPGNNLIVVGYENGNIDIVKDGSVRNFPDFLLSKIASQKTIYAIVWNNNLAYLATNIGIVVLNASKFEVVETYFPSSNGLPIPVYQLAFMGDNIFAATADGIKKASLVQSNLNDYRSWSKETSKLVENNIRFLFKWGDGLVAQLGDTLLYYSNANWKTFYTSPKKITALNVSNNVLFVAETSNGTNTLLSFASSSSVPQIFKSSLVINPNYCFNDGTNYWIGDAKNGLIKLTGTQEQKIMPNGPGGIATGQAAFQNETIAIPAADPNTIYNSAIKNQLFVFKNEQWKNYTPENTNALKGLADFTSTAIDPTNEYMYIGTKGSGLVGIDKDGKINLQGPVDGGLQVDRDVNSLCTIASLAFDLGLNLWMTNPNTNAPLVVKKKDGTWKNYSVPFDVSKNQFSKIITDSENRKWITTSNGKGLICFDDRRTIDVTSDDQWRYFLQGTGQGNLPSSNVLSVAEDQTGNIWVGTDRGIGIIQCGNDLFSSSKCDATLPIVQQDNFAGLLLANEIINDIKVDGADRKWIASKNGVWLLSADGRKVVYRFTSSNSKLLDNMVYSIVIQENTGEVFFMTAKGICSFRSTAIRASDELKKPIVFPNPVPPGYTGAIAIKDLPINAWVKITELDGRLVHQTRSLGGQAVWDGKNYKGERVNSGVYLLIISTQDNSKQVSGKIFFIK